MVADITYNPAGQVMVEGSNRTLKEMLIEQKRDVESPKDSSNNTLLTLTFKNTNKTDSTAAEKHYILERTAELDQHKYIICLRMGDRT